MKYTPLLQCSILNIMENVAKNKRLSQVFPVIVVNVTNHCGGIT